MSYQNRKRKITRKHFTESEDEDLRTAVKELGVFNWRKIARRMRNRDAKQCKDRWTNYLSPLVKKREWSTAEEQLLVEKVFIFGRRWKLLAQFFEGRSEIDLKNRYFLILRRAKCEDSCPNNSFNASNQQQTIENPNFKIVPNCFIPSNILNNSIFILNGLNLNCINSITNFNSQDNIPNSSANTRGINYGIHVINYGIINNSNSSMIGSVNPNTSENTILIGNVMNDHLNGFQSAILISNQTTQLNEINGLNLVKTNMISDDYRPNNSSYCQATKNTINFQLPKIEENNEKQLNSEELSTDNLNKEISNSSCTSLPNIDEFLHQIQKA